MSIFHVCRLLGNKVYELAFPVYQPLYSAYKAFSDRAERRILAERLRPGAVVVDAGANIGIYSQFLAKCVGPDGEVHSFEPSPDNFGRLSAALGSLINVRLHQLALGEGTGESLLYMSDELNVDHRCYLPAGEARRAVSIRSQSLDDCFQPGRRVDLIKMDIQGYELHALRGAERVLADNPGLILLLEFWPYGLRQAGSSGTALASFLRERGFSFFEASSNGLEACNSILGDDEDASKYTNLFAERRDSKRSGKTFLRRGRS